MGEMHYSRFSQERWNQNLAEMKSLGVDIVSTYIIWVHHEEEEGVWDFSGNKDLREFIREARDNGLYIWLRIGPWCHAEVRRGGFPDWLVQKGYQLRRNDSGYFAEVEKFYRKIFEQADGCFLDQGGNIIGVQIENEYGHVGKSITAEEGERHMRALYGMAREIGFRAPYFSATGWGGAYTGGLIPVMGGYCDAPWDPRITEIEPSSNFLFSDIRDDAQIASDFGVSGDMTYDQSKYPYLTAELGGGLQVTRHRRPVASSKDAAAMTLVKMGSGASLLGYYMFCGGTNPHGKFTTLQETKAVGDYNDLPEYSYDFNAPIRQYGNITEKALNLKTYFMFLHDFGRSFADMTARFPSDEPRNASDATELRYSWRQNDKGQGYLFVNNYQRGCVMANHAGVTLCAEDTPGHRVYFDPMDIRDGDFFFYPYNFPVGDRGGRVISVNAQPLCCLRRDGRLHYIFICNDSVNPASVKFHCAGDVDGITLQAIPRGMAFNAWKLTDDKGDFLLISPWPIVKENGKYTAIYTNEDGTDRKQALKIGNIVNGIGHMIEAENGDKPEKPVISCEKTDGADADTVGYHLHVRYPDNYTGDLVLTIDYTANTMDVLIDGRKEDDSFYTGQTYEINLGYYHNPTDIDLVLHKLTIETPVYLEKWPDVGTDGVARLNDVKMKSRIKVPVVR